MDEQRALRKGYTTGSCAAAGAIAAARLLLGSELTEAVKLRLPKGGELSIPVRFIERGRDTAVFEVTKDSGDDPDVTNGTTIRAALTLSRQPGVRIDGGEGVGRVTKPGLDQPVGAAAINSVPRRMIEANLLTIADEYGYGGGFDTVISAPNGQELAGKTFNPRLGIVGGISILGTTGIVEPMSEDAIIKTIHITLRQRRAEGARRIILIPGNYAAAFLEKEYGISDDIPVQISNYVGNALDNCSNLKFSEGILVGHIGKLVKLAGGMMNTHSKYGDCRMEILAAHAAASGGSAELARGIMGCATCDEALRLVREAEIDKEVMTAILGRILFHIKARTKGAFSPEVLIYSNVYGILAQTPKACAMLRAIQEEGL